jgi:hypothetical protein
MLSNLRKERLGKFKRPCDHFSWSPRRNKKFAIKSWLVWKHLPIVLTTMWWKVPRQGPDPTTSEFTTTTLALKYLGKRLFTFDRNYKAGIVTYDRRIGCWWRSPTDAVLPIPNVSFKRGLCIFRYPYICMYVCTYSDSRAVHQHVTLKYGRSGLSALNVNDLARGSEGHWPLC